MIPQRRIFVQYATALLAKSLAALAALDGAQIIIAVAANITFRLQDGEDSTLQVNSAFVTPCSSAYTIKSISSVAGLIVALW